MITIYDSKETNFEHNGLGALIPSSCYITEELNGSYYLELEHPKDQARKYERLQGWNIIKASGQLFRIPMLTKFQESKLGVKVRAEHIFYDLINDFIEDVRAESKTVTEALKIAVTNPKFNVMPSDLTTLNSAYFVGENPVESIFKKVLFRWGGELYRDNFNIAIKSRIGKDTGILISYGKNIMGFEQTLDYSTIATRIRPVGKDGLTIDLVNGGSKCLESPRINDYPFVITKELKFEDIEDAGELKAKVESLWGIIDIPSVNYKINFIDLSKTEEYKNLKSLLELNLGDTVIIRHKVFGVDISARVIKTKKNVLTGRLEEIELGQFKDNIYGYMNNLDGRLAYTQGFAEDINEDLKGTKTIVFQNDEQIKLQAQKIIDNESNIASLSIKADSIESNVTENKNDVENFKSSITQRADSIESTVTTNKADVDSFKSTITQRASNIEINVQNVNSNLNSSINVQAGRIDVLSNTVNINGTYFNLDGTISTAGLRGDVITFNNGYSLDTRGNANGDGIRLRYDDYHYHRQNANGFQVFFPDGSGGSIARFQVQSDGAYFDGVKLGTATSATVVAKFG